LDELSNSADDLSARARQFGISNDALAEIEETTEIRVRERALQIASKGFWNDRRMELYEVRGGDRLGQFLCVHDLAIEFGEVLRPMLVETGEEYVEMLTQAIMEHRGKHKPIRWKLIAEQAIASCCRASSWQQSSEWLAKMLETAGFRGEHFNPRAQVAFETILLGWMVIFRSWDNEEPLTGFYEVALRKIRHLVRLAPKTSVTNDASKQRIESPIPSLVELEKKAVITQRRAAEHLRCDRRTIRRYIKNGELTKTERSLIVCDDKLKRKLRQKFGPAVS
jgi:hypothetical protein